MSNTTTESFPISRQTLGSALTKLMTHTEDELGEIMWLAMKASWADSKAGNIESAAYNDLIATQCVHALKLKAMLDK